MNAIVIEHVPVADLPAAWRAKLGKSADALVTVPIEVEAQAARAALQPRRLAQRALTMPVDTDVLIWHLRGCAQATRRLDELGALTLSAVSYLEVLPGMRSKAELVAVKKMLERRAATLLPVSEAITLRAIDLMELLTLSHGLQMGDALIEATALDHGLSVLTANVKHFSPVEGLNVEAFSP